MQMQAAVLNATHSPFRIETVDIAAPQAGEVRVKVAAAGICHSDWHVVEGQSYFPLPIICGHEGAGVVESVGEGVSSLKPGDHVTLSFRANCGECFYCQRDKANLCEVFSPVLRSGLMKDGESRITRDGEPVHIMTGLGCFAEYVVIDQSAAVPIRADVPLEVAALVGCAVSTGVGAAMFTAEVRAGQSVAVFGAGGVGLNIIQGAALCGADPIIAVDTNSNKMEIAREFGATHTLYSDDNSVNEIQALTGGRGADYTFEAIGVGACMEQAYMAARRGGTATIVGVGRFEDTFSLSAGLFAITEKTLKGSFCGKGASVRDFPRMLDWYRSGLLDLDSLVTTTYPLEDVAQAYEDMSAGKNARGVVVF